MTGMITLKDAKVMVANALAKGREDKLKPLTVVVLDAGGHVKAVEREDGASNLRFEVARAKAYGALAVGLGSRALMKRAEEQPYFVSALNGLADGKVMPVPGGVLIKDASGATFGAIGISGDTSDADETCCVAGVEAAGYTAETG